MFAPLYVCVCSMSERGSACHHSWAAAGPPRSYYTMCTMWPGLHILLSSDILISISISQHRHIKYISTLHCLSLGCLWWDSEKCAMSLQNDPTCDLTQTDGTRNIICTLSFHIQPTDVSLRQCCLAFKPLSLKDWPIGPKILAKLQ